MRFTRIITFMSAVESVKLSLKLIKLVFYLAMYLHIQACAWFYYTKQDRTWYPLIDVIEGSEEFYDHGFAFTYCFSLWHSVQLLDGDDMIPATTS